LSEVEGLAVEALQRLESAVLGHLDWFPSFMRYFPDFIAAGSVGSEVNPLPVHGEARAALIGRCAHDMSRRTAARRHHVDVTITAAENGEGQLLSVGRPADTVGNDVAEGRELKRIPALGIRHVDFPSAGPVGRERNSASIRRQLGIEISARGRDHRHSGVLSQTPDILLKKRALIHEPVRSGGDCRPSCPILQPRES
jgi:hypothetical protein